MADCDDVPTRRRRPRLTVDQGDDAPSSSEEAKRRRRRRKKNRRSSELDPPFHILVMQVGATLFTLCFVTFYLWQSIFLGSSSDNAEALIEEGYDDDATLREEVEEAMAASKQQPTQAPTIPTAPPLPVWELGEATRFDAFGIADTHSESQSENDKARKTQAFWTTTASLRKQFAELYGGENAVRAMMERGFTFSPWNLIFIVLQVIWYTLPVEFG